MDSFYKTHQHLVENVQSPVRRQLMDKINWNDRLIGIKGSRGVGKTTFLLQYAKESFGSDRSCLYVNFNNFYFSTHSLVEFAGAFCEQGGKILLLDQIFKYENWSKELRECYDRFPELRIVFSGSSVMRLKESNDDLKDIVTSYNLRGFSFREFLNLKSGFSLPTYTLDELIVNHVQIATDICNQVNPLEYFKDYVHHGYYPFFLENRNYSENLLKTMNMILEVDILLIKQIELKYLSKIRKLLYLLLTSSPDTPNVSQLSQAIQTSRATIMNYIKYLKDARLINTLYPVGNDYPKKPSQVYVHNTNLLHAVVPTSVDACVEQSTFFYNAMRAQHKVNRGSEIQDFVIDQHYLFRCESVPTNTKRSSEVYYAVNALEIGKQNEIPLWLFGFLY
jgi:predicted AAA+ superfamily ATPase